MTGSGGDRMREYLPPLSRAGWRWARFFGLLAALATLGWVLYRLSSVVTPILASLAIAYILNPLVTRLEQWKLRRLFTVIVVYVLVTLAIVSATVFAGFKAIDQIGKLRDEVPQLARTLAGFIDGIETRARRLSPRLTPLPSATQPETAPATQESAAAPPTGRWRDRLSQLLREHGAAIVGSALAAITGLFTNFVALVSLFILIPMYTFFFLWRFNDMVRVVREHLPTAYRPMIEHTVRTIDSAVANFFRGRLIVCMIIATITGLGWEIVGVRFGLLLGMLAGLFNLVPFLSVLALPPALILSYLGAADAGQSWFWPVVLTMGVYMGAQAVESFLLSPLIESQTNKLHPVTTVAALLIGADAAGTLGMLLAIPLASTLKTLAAEFVLPEIRRLAGTTPGPPGTQAPAGVSSVPRTTSPAATPAESAAEPGKAAPTGEK